jgi:hypothetical protein
MTFTYDNIAFQELESITAENGERVYFTPDGQKYPSITTVLSGDPAKQELLRSWRKRVGEEKAASISRIASTRGTKIHSLMESYVLRNQIPDNRIMPPDMRTFKQIQRAIDGHLSVVIGNEAPMYSHKLKIAGRADLIGIWDNDCAIIDFKTSLRTKREEWIGDYFIQTTAYSLMYEELRDMACSKVVVIIACDDTQEAQVFVRNREEYVAPLKDRIDAFYSRRNSIAV